MDIYEFINSKDIRAYLRERRYAFDPLQCAFLIYQSGRHTLEEKHAAWQEIIDTMPDMPVPKRLNCTGWESLHTMLRDYMAMENKYLARLKQPETNAVYSPRFEATGESTSELQEDDNYLTQDYWACFDYACSQSQSNDMEKFCIEKRYIDCKGFMCSIKAIFDQNGKLLSVEWYLPPESKTIGEHLKGIPHGTKAEFDLKWDSFDGLWFDIPIPFERGDIVCDCFRKEPFVLMGTTPWYWRQNRPKDGVRWRGDSTDMDAQGYGHDADSSFLYDDYRCDYLNLEYYREELRGSEKLLAAYSSYVKKEPALPGGKWEMTDAFTLMRLARMYQAEDYATRERKALSYYFEKSEQSDF